MSKWSYMSNKVQGRSLTFDLNTELTQSANKLMVQTPEFMILKRDIKPHSMSLASNKYINGLWEVFCNDLQIHFKKHSALRWTV